ncbi:MAG: hypothetical protein CVV51_14845 [Spirochaetae bacterium HGW-Spirochaetae-7]|nr:MAG: hypothetical protein CVV51_14845 [Spirochaetae bacterium HGW-Spirochaetae-7]
MAEDDLATAMAVSRDRIRALEKALEAAEDRGAGLEAASLAAVPSDVAGNTVVLASARNIAAAARLARALAALGRVAVVSSPADFKVAAASPAGSTAQSPKAAETGTAMAAMDAGSVFGPLARTFGGSGGGGKTFFQAAFPDKPSLAAFMDAARRV